MTSATRVQQSYKLPFGVLMAQTLRVYLRNLPPFFLLGVLVFAPWIALAFYHYSVPPKDPLMGPLINLGELVLQSVLGMVLTGGITYGVVQQLRGTPSGIAVCVTQGLRNFGRVFGTGFVCGLRIFGMTLLLVVPGIIEACRLYVAVPTAVMERGALGRNIERSINLTAGSRLVIFGVFAFIYLSSMLLFIVIGVWVALQGSGDSIARRGEQMNPWIEVPITILFQTAFATASSVTYFMLRKGKENIDVAEIAAVFD